MAKFFLILLLCFGLKTNAQGFLPNWYILEEGCSVGIVKAGVNDIMLYMATHSKAIDKAAVDEINEGISFRAGSAVLVYAKFNGVYMASDIEGRTLLIKGNITAADNKENSGVGFIKQNIQQNGVNIKYGTYVWIKKVNAEKKTVTVQYAGKKDVQLEADKLYIINETTAEMMPAIKFKEAQN